MKYKKVILIDLDGVLNNYNGKFDANFIPPIRIGAKEFLEEISIKYNVVLFTTRNKELAEQWLKESQIDDLISHVTNYKEASYLIIDDRCITFTGNYVDILDKLDNFKPWYK